MKIDQVEVQLMKRQGGVGHDLSHISPKGSPVKNSALTSTGIVPFMERYSNSTREVMVNRHIISIIIRSQHIYICCKILFALFQSIINHVLQPYMGGKTVLVPKER